MAEDVCQPRRGGRKSRALRIGELERENERLRGALRLGPKTYESAGVQEFRDLMAADALVAEWGNEERALVRLGLLPAVRQADWHERESIAQRVLRTPSVLAHVARMMQCVEDRRGEMLERQSRIACSSDDETALRAFEPLSRLLGWKKGAAEHVHAVEQRSSLQCFLMSVVSSDSAPPTEIIDDSDEPTEQEEVERRYDTPREPLPWE